MSRDQRMDLSRLSTQQLATLFLATTGQKARGARLEKMADSIKGQVDRAGIADSSGRISLLEFTAWMIREIRLAGD